MTTSRRGWDDFRNRKSSWTGRADHADDKKEDFTDKLKLVCSCTTAMMSILFLAILSIHGINVFATESEVPKGHMKPFGAHMPPGKVDELTVDTLPSPQDFWKKYVSKRKPVVFRGVATHSPSYHKWTDEYLKENFGDMEVRLEARKEKQGYIPVGDKGVGRDTVRNFIDTYHTTNKYIVSELPFPMYKDVMVFPPMACGEMSRKIVEVDWWMNGGSAASIIHKDAYNQINCLMNGTKEWKLIEYKYEKQIYKAWEPEREVGGYSRINPNKVDMKKYPKVASVPWQLTFLNAGDCLYLPGSMYHQVNSNGSNNFAVSLLFSRFDGRKDLDFSDCASPSCKPLSELDVDWKYPGTGLMTMGASDLEGMREVLLSIVDKDGKLSLKRWYHHMKEPYEGKDKNWVKELAKKTFKQIVNITGKKIKIEDIEAVPKDALRIMALTVQPMDASNTYDHEYTYVNPHEIRDLIEEMSKKSGKLVRKEFAAKYQKNLFGTAEFANRAFDIIAGKSNDVATKEQIQSKMDEALAKYFENQREQIQPPKGETSDGDAYDGTNADTEMHETGMPDMSEGDEDTGMPDMTEGEEDTGMPDMTEGEEEATGMPEKAGKDEL